MVSEQFLQFKIEAYSKNDLKAAPELELQARDLILRDRGYLTTKEIIRHFEAKADFIFRHRFRTIYLDKITRQPIDLHKLLKLKRSVDMEVRLNTSPETIVRIVAMPVAKEIADMRKCKAKREFKNVSQLYLKMLDWSIFITSIKPDKADFKTLLDFYSLRWKIETIFKNWKSNLKFDKIHNVSNTQLKILLRSRFLVIVLMQHIHSVVKHIIRKKLGRLLSFMKLTSYLSDKLYKLNDIMESMKTTNNTITNEIFSVSYYCCYDKRKDRSNFEEEMIKIFNL